MTTDKFTTLLSPESPLRRYAAALLPALVVLFGAVQTAIADGIVTETEGGQLLALFAGLILTYALPLTSGVWAGLLKTGAAILAAVASLVIPLINGFSWTALLIFGIAILQAVATEIGVDIRKRDFAAAA